MHLSRISTHLLCLTLFILTGWTECRAETPNADGFKRWLASFREAAIAEGIKPEVYDKIAAGLAPNFSLPDLDFPKDSRGGREPEQPEFIKTPEQYLNEKYMESMALKGRKLLEAHAKTLAHIRHVYGLEPNILLALWGRETAFGDYKLPHNALQVLATQAYAGLRRDDFQKQFIAALRMVQEHVIEPKDMHSSWAGAMGLVQFLPSDYWNYAVDEDGDGRRDIWKSVPDALASLANNLKSIGWDSSQPWGIEVNVPNSIDCSQANLDVRKTVSEWGGMGITPLKGKTFDAGLLQAEASLLLPAGTYGPGFLTFKNFQIIREYNKSDLYALFVGHLADRIGGRPGFSRKWDQVIQVSSADVEELQRHLTAKGLYQDKVDGKAGGRTRSALGLYQKSVGLKQTCWPTPEIITHIRKSASIH